MQKPPKGGYRDIAQFGRALGLGPRGFRFKSGYSDFSVKQNVRATRHSCKKTFPER